MCGTSLNVNQIFGLQGPSSTFGIIVVFSWVSSEVKVGEMCCGLRGTSLHGRRIATWSSPVLDSTVYNFLSSPHASLWRRGTSVDENWTRSSMSPAALPGAKA